MYLIGCWICGQPFVLSSVTHKASIELNPTPNLPPYSTPIVCPQIMQQMMYLVVYNIVHNIHKVCDMSHTTFHAVLARSENIDKTNVHGVLH